jgi:hypothetical protein
MSIKEKLDQLQVSEISNIKSILKTTGTAKMQPAVIRISGILAGKSGDCIYVIANSVLYQIAVDNVISIDKDESQPSRDQLGDGVAVFVTILPDAEIIEMRSIHTGALCETVGIRPLAFALPSKAEQYKVVNNGMIFNSPYPTEYQCPYQSPSETFNRTPHSTPHTTHIGNGTQQDSDQDWSDDLTTDYTTDYRQDHD